MSRLQRGLNGLSGAGASLARYLLYPGAETSAMKEPWEKLS